MGQVSQNKSSQLATTKTLRNRRKRARKRARGRQFTGGFTVANSPIGNFEGNLGFQYRQRSGMGLNPAMSYRSEVPVAIGSVDSIAGPTILNGPDGAIRIVNREYLADISAIGDLDFQIVQTYLGNPSLPANFPWLSSVANSFEKYCFNKLDYHYVTQSSTAAVGSVMIVPDYDPQSSPPTTKQQALSFKDSVRTPPWQEACSTLPYKRLCSYEAYFVDLASGEQRLSNPVTTYICTSGASDANPIQGEIWVEYDIFLMIPRHSNLPGFDLFQSASYVSADEIFATKLSVTPSGSPIVTAGVKYLPDNPTCILPQGNYTIHVAASADSLTSFIIAEGASVTTYLVASDTTATQFQGWYGVVVASGNTLERALSFVIVTSTEAVAAFYWNLIRM